MDIQGNTDFCDSFFLPDKSFALQYELLINSSAPTTGTIRLIFEDALHAETRLIFRQLKESNIKNPICSTSGKTLSREDDGGWMVPAGSSEIIWGIQFIEVDRPNHDVSAQENLYYPGKWWLFSEWGNLLRLASNTAESEICTKDRAICRHVPSSKEAPLLMLVGEPSKQVTSGETSFNFFLAIYLRPLTLKISMDLMNNSYPTCKKSSLLLTPRHLHKRLTC